MSKISKTYKISKAVSDVTARAAKIFICSFFGAVVVSLAGALVADLSKKH